MPKGAPAVTDKNEQATEKSQVEAATDQVLAVGRAAIETAQEAIAKAQDAVEKIQQEGNRIFETLVKESGKVLQETQRLAGEKVEDMKGKVEEAKSKAAETFDNLEQIFEERVSRALSRLGIPTRDDFQAIANRLEELNQSIQTLIKNRGGKEKPVTTTASVRDDLKEINGIGPAIEHKLNAEGITSYRQIALLSAAEAERIETQVIHSAGRILRENWIGQAKQLHAKKHGERL
jgi:poly(hydroxyalkanoate) granule-associated protein